MSCPFCQSDNASSVLVCATCGRDIAVPESLVLERDALLRKRDVLREALAIATSELETWERRKKRPSS
jgi:DNA-binding transcriptional regulator YiaG